MEEKNQKNETTRSVLGPHFEPAAKKPKPKNGAVTPEEKFKKFVIIAVAVSLIGGYGGGYLAASNKLSSNTASTDSSKQVIDSESDLITSIAKDVGESVVSINVQSKATRTSFFGGAQSYTQQSAGTGFIVDADKGIVVTNRHVVADGLTSVSVTLSDGTELSDVEVIGKTNSSDPLDVAFLKINDKKGKDLKAVKLGDSSKMQVGDRVIAIGNALGMFQNTVTTGIISGYGRSIEAGDQSGGGTESLQNLFQTDASINQGNSGGPLVNVNGEVIGINTAVAGGSAENIGFSIPINDIQGLIKSVIVQGKLLRPYLGVRYVTLNDDYAYQFNLDVKRGAYIAPQARGQASILPGSPAEKAGLKEKDIITKANDQPIDENNSLISVLGKYSVGDKVTLTVVRDGQEMKIDVTLEAAPQN